MASQTLTSIQEPQSIESRLQPNAISTAQDTVIGMAYAAPTLSIGLTLAGLVAATSYAVGPIILLTAVPMIIIANAYRRLNLWNANCGASFEWVGRAINPYLGFFTGWLMIAATLTGTTSVLALFDADPTATWPNIAISTGVILAMLVIAIVGIRLTARTQVGLAAVEYAILIAFAIAGLIAVLGHRHGSFPITKEWFQLKGIGGHGSLAAGLLIAVFMYTGWDATVYVNEEVKHRRTNPGRAAVFAVALVTVIFVLTSIGLAGVVSPAKLQANSSSTLVYIAQALGGSGWAKVMAFALALSVIACTGVAVVILARMIYGMANHRVLPPILGNVSTRFSTPVVASVVVGVILIVITWVYLLSGSIANVFTQLIDVTGLLCAAYYILTALAAMVYYRRRIFSAPWDALLAGVLPAGAIAFLGWILVKSIMGAPASQLWSLAGVGIAGIVLLFIARYVLRAQFFSTPRESAESRRS
jgi:amino acid transporter